MNEQTSKMINQNQHQQQMMSMNMNQNPQQMMSMNQHQPQQQVMKPPNPNPLRNYNNLFNPNLMGTINPNNNNYIISKGNHLKNPQSTNNNSNNPQMMLNQPPPPSQPMMNRSYGMWAPPLPAPSMDQLKFQNPNPKMKVMPGGGGGGGVGGFLSGKQQQQQQQHQGLKPLGPRSNWKGKKVNDKRKDGRRKENIGMSLMAGTSSGVGGISAGGGGGTGGYKPPMLHELQHQNRVKARRFFTKKKFNPYYHNNSGGNNMGKFAPRNTSSFIIRAKKSGGIAELVSPAQVTPAVLPTPIFSPSREVLVDMAKEEWGVDGYGSMKGLIRLRSPGREDEVHDGDEEEEDGGGSSESDVEEHVEVERRLDHDLSRFEMIYPNHASGMDYNNLLENRVDDQDTHIAQLEEENLILKERLFLMERELGDLRRRLHCLERQRHGGGEETNEEVVENESDNDSESRGEAHSMEDNNEEFIGENMEGYGDVERKGANKDIDDEVKAFTDNQDIADVGGKEDKDNRAINDGVKAFKENKDIDDEVKAFTDDQNMADVEGKEEKDNSAIDDGVKAFTDDQNVADVKGREEEDNTAIELKDETMGDNVKLNEENNGEVRNEDQNDEINARGLGGNNANAEDSS